MRPFFVLLFCLATTPALAQQHEFRGDFVETYLAEAGFLDKIPRGTKLNCEDHLCSTSKSVRIYVYKNAGQTKKFWSTDYLDVMFDEKEALQTCGKTVAYFDETDQLLFRDQNCREDADQWHRDLLNLKMSSNTRPIAVGHR
jgi:hypothetical protein